MNLVEVISDYSILTLIFLAVLAFTAGFIDSVVGGGGLIQIPALLIAFPEKPIAALFGTNKIAALSGTSFAAYQYSREIKFDPALLIIISMSAFIASHGGAKAVSAINTHALKPAILIILIIIALYSFVRKDLGSSQSRSLSRNMQFLYGIILGTFVGFYDGFFGPGTGSFFVLGFVILLGFEFITASAYSKIINCVTNLSALIVFIHQGNYITEPAILMAVCNIAGSITGSRMALKRGNRFVRIFFLIIVSIMIIRFGWDIVTGR
jgi:uncharacterized membrane protein YfcA